MAVTMPERKVPYPMPKEPQGPSSCHPARNPAEPLSVISQRASFLPRNARTVPEASDSSGKNRNQLPPKPSAIAYVSAVSAARA